MEGGYPPLPTHPCYLFHFARKAHGPQSSEARDISYMVHPTKPTARIQLHASADAQFCKFKTGAVIKCLAPTPKTSKQACLEIEMSWRFRQSEFQRKSLTQLLSPLFLSPGRRGPTECQSPKEKTLSLPFSAFHLFDSFFM